MRSFLFLGWVGVLFFSSVSFSSDLIFNEEYGEYLTYQQKAPLTKVAYQTDLGIFFKWCASQGIDFLEIESQDLQIFLDHLSESKKPSSVRRMSSAVSGFYRFLEKKRKLSKNPFLAIRVPKVERSYPFLTNDEVKKVVHDPPGETLVELRGQLTVLIVLSTGISPRELHALNLEDVLTSDNDLQLRVRRGKDAEVIEIYGDWKDHLATVLLKYTKVAPKSPENEKPPLFRNQEGKRITVRTSRRDIYSYLRSLEIPDEFIRLQVLRNTFANYFYSKMLTADLASQMGIEKDHPLFSHCQAELVRRQRRSRGAT